VSVGDATVAAALAVAAGTCATVAMRAGERDRIRRRLGRQAPDRDRAARDHRRWLAIGRMLGAAAAGWWLAHAVGVLVGVAAALVAPRFLARRRDARRTEAIDEGMADAVSSISAGLRAGMSVLTSIDRAASDVDEPLAGCLREIVARTSLGVPLDDSLARFSSDVGTPGARLVATTLALHHRDGGDGPAVLDRLAVTLRARADSEREVRSLTAQARLSGTILGVLPVAFFLFLMATSRDDLTAAYRSPAGATAIATGFAMQGLAFMWIRRLLRVEP
jgi:tight adherence protein B